MNTRIDPSITVILAARLAHRRGYALRAARRPGQPFGFVLKPLREKK